MGWGGGPMCLACPLLPTYLWETAGSELSTQVSLCAVVTSLNVPSGKSSLDLQSALRRKKKEKEKTVVCMAACSGACAV